MFKYCFYTFLLTLFIACGNPSRRTYTPPPRVTSNINQPGQCFLGLMEVSNKPIYEIFLAEAPHFCRKTGGRWLVNKQIYEGFGACKNWTSFPTVGITFDLKFTKFKNSKSIQEAVAEVLPAIKAFHLLLLYFTRTHPFHPKIETKDGTPASLL